MRRFPQPASSGNLTLRRESRVSRAQFVVAIRDGREQQQQERRGPVSFLSLSFSLSIYLVNLNLVNCFVTVSLRRRDVMRYTSPALFLNLESFALPLDEREREGCTRTGGLYLYLYVYSSMFKVLFGRFLSCCFERNALRTRFQFLPVYF